MALTLQQFGQSIKEKYPEYKDKDDLEVGQAMLQKYPEYKDRIQETNVPQDKIQELKQYRDFQPTSEMTPGQQFAGGMQKDRYRNIEKEPTFFSKFARKASDVAPTVGSTVAGTIGRVLGRKPGAVASGAGFGVGQAFGESLENIAGIQEETPGELAKEAITKPLAVGAADYAMDYGMEKAGKALKPAKDKITGFVKGIGKEFLPNRKGIFKSIFTVPRKIASRMDLDGMSQKMVDYDISGNLDDLENISRKVTGGNGVMTKAVRDTLGKVKTPINTNSALEAAQFSANDALNLDEKVANKTLRKVTNMVSKSQGDLPGRNNAIDVWDTIQSLEKEGYNLMGKSTDLTPRIDMEQQAQIFLSAADALKDQIDDMVVSEGVVDSIKNKYYKNLIDVSPKLANEFMQTKSIRDIRSLAKPFVDLSNATRLTKESGTSVMEKLITGQSTGTQSVSINKPLTWLNPILQRPGVKSKIAKSGKGIISGTSKGIEAVPKVGKGLIDAFNVGRRAATSFGADKLSK